MKLNDFLKKLTEKWSSLTGTRKSMVTVMGVAVILAAIFFGQWLTRKDFMPLYTEMEPETAYPVVEKLKEMKIPYRLADEGSTVLVPKEQVYELRMQLASEGVVESGGSGFELFDQTRLGMTDFERRLNYQRALQEELRRTIVSVLQDVEQARVHLVLPEPSLFVEEDRPASASIALKLKPFAKLKREQVRGIIKLVASSVENLPPENVNVIDMQGNILSEGVISSGEIYDTQLTATQQELKRSFERDLERRIQNLLERILGPGKAVVMVTAELDFDVQEETSVNYGDSTILSEQTIIDEGSSTGQAAPPVAEGNRPNTGSYGAVSGEESEYSRRETTTNYMIDKTETKTVRAPGRVVSLSTAVVVDGPLSDQQTGQIQQLVSSAVGYQDGRSQVNVMSMAFDNSFLEENKEAMSQLAEKEQRQKQVEQYVNWGLTGLGIILAFLLLLVLVRRLGSGKSADYGPVPEMVPVGEIAVAQQEPPEVRQQREAQIKVREIVSQKPEEAAQLIKTWLAEE